MSYIGKKPSFSQVRTAELVVQRGTDITTSGTIDALDVSNISLVRLTAASILRGIVAPSSPANNGKKLTIINANTSDLIVRNESSSATAANRITTGVSRDMRITPGASLTLVYNTASSRWSVESSSSEINIDRLRVASEVVTSGPDIAALNSGNGKSTLLELASGFGTSVRSISAGLSGQFVVLVNKTGSIIQVANEDSGVGASDRILTGTGGPISLQNNASLFLAYLTDNNSASRWNVVGGTGSGGGATEQVTQTGLGNLTNFPVGTPLYVSAATGWTKADATTAATAEVAGILGRSLGADLAEVVMAGEVAGVTSAAFSEGVLPPRGEAVFLSPTSGKLTITEPSVVGQVSKPLGIVHNVNGSTSVDIMFYNMRGTVVGGANVRTKIYLSNNFTNNIQSVAAYDAGEIAGWVYLDGTVDYRFYVQAQFAKNAAGTDYNLAYQTTGDTPPAGFSLTVTAAGMVQCTLPSGAYQSATSFIQYALNAPAVGATLPLAIDSSLVQFSSVQAKDVGGISVRNAAGTTTNLFVSDAGNVGIGTSSPSVASGSGLEINGKTDAARIALKNNTTGSASGDGFQLTAGFDGIAYIEQRENNSLVFSTNLTERARIDASGNLLVGNTAYDSASTGVLCSANGRLYATTDSIPACNFNRKTTTGTVIDFQYNTAPVGTISTNGSTITFSGNALSDERWKENINPIENALSAIMSVEFVSFDYKDNKKPSAGVVAQQLQRVEGLGKFVVDGAGEEDYKAVDYNAIIGYLGKAIQEQQALIGKQSQAIEKLEARLAALGG